MQDPIVGLSDVESSYSTQWQDKTWPDCSPADHSLKNKYMVDVNAVEQVNILNTNIDIPIPISPDKFTEQ